MSTLILRVISEQLRLRIANLVRPFHPTSLPYLSGDTFRSFCHVQVDSELNSLQVRRAIMKLSAMEGENALRVFVDLHVVQGEDAQASFLALLGELPIQIRRRTLLVFHNHDKLPPPHFFTRLAELNFRSFSVNVVDTDHDAQPLPIGLENRWRLNNGRIGPFAKWLTQLEDEFPRSRMVFAAFNVGTNISERLAARASCIGFGVPVFEHRISPRHHRRLLRESHFVISPPGNGPDCHRTWEAIYLGCVPVVLRRHLAEEFVNELPILAVDTWSEFLELTDDEKKEIFSRIRMRSKHLAFANGWKQRLEVESET